MKKRKGGCLQKSKPCVEYNIVCGLFLFKIQGLNVRIALKFRSHGGYSIAR